MQPSVTQDRFQRWWRGFFYILAISSKARAGFLTYSSMAGSKDHEAKRHNNILAGQWIHWGHGWAPDSDQKNREWAGKSRKKLQAQELCEKVSICSMLDTAQNKQVKFKPQKDSQSSCLKYFQTEDYHLTILKGLRNCQFCGLSHHSITDNVQSSYTAGWRTAGCCIRRKDSTVDRWKVPWNSCRCHQESCVSPVWDPYSTNITHSHTEVHSMVCI